MIANVGVHKSIRICKHGISDDVSGDWVSHTLASLKVLEATEQSQLALHLVELTVVENKSEDTFELRVKSRYTLKTLIVLIYAEKHWRSAVGLTILNLNKNGSIYD